MFILLNPDIPPLLLVSFRDYLDYQKDYERCALLRFDLFGQDIHDVLEAVRDMDEVILVSDASVEKLWLDHLAFQWSQTVSGNISKTRDGQHQLQTSFNESSSSESSITSVALQGQHSGS